MKGCEWMLAALHRHFANTLHYAYFKQTTANFLNETVVLYIDLNSELLFGPVLAKEFYDFLVVTPNRKT